MVDVHNTFLRQALDNYVPLKTMCAAGRPSAPGISEEICEARRALHRAEKLANRSKLTVHRKISVKQPLLKGLHRSAKQELYCNKLIDCTSAKFFFFMV